MTKVRTALFDQSDHRAKAAIPEKSLRPKAANALEKQRIGSAKIVA